MSVIPKHYQLQTRSSAAEAAQPFTLAQQRRLATRRWWQWLAAGGRRLLWLEPLWLIALLPSLLARDYLWDPWVHPWLVAALFLFWPLRLLVTQQLAPATPLTWSIGLLGGWSWLGVVAAPDPERAWAALGYLAVGIALYFALVNWRPTQRHPWLVLVLLAGCGAALAALGPLLLINISDEFFIVSDELLRSQPLDIFGTGETINPNVLGGILAILLPPVLALALRWERRRKRWLHYTSAGVCTLLASLMLATLILTQSRGAYLAATAGVAVVLIARWSWSVLVLAVAGCAAAVTLAVNGGQLFLEAVGTSDSITSLSGRWEVWERALFALRDFPLTGIGLGAFDLVIPQLYPYVENAGADIPHAHNLWLQVGVDLGLPGLLLYTWVLFLAIRGLIQTRRRATHLHAAVTADLRPGPHQRQDRRQRRRLAVLRGTIAAGLLGGLTALLVDGIIDAVTWDTKLAFVPWLLLSLTTLLQQSEYAEPSEEP